MGDISTPSPPPCHGGIDSQLLLLQFLHQVCNTTRCAEQDVQYCIQKQRLLNQAHSKLLTECDELEKRYLYEANYTDNLTETLETLETNLEEVTAARESCERNATLQKELELMNKGLHELRNCSHKVDRKIRQVSETLHLISQDLNMEYEEKMNELRRKLQNETSARSTCERNAILQKVRERRNCSHNVDGKISEVSETLQLMSQKLNMVKRIHDLRKLSSLTNDIIQSSTHMYRRQSWELQNERRKTQNLQESNAQLNVSLHELQNEQHEREQRYQDELRNKTDQLKTKDEQLQKTEEELNSTQDELKNKNDQLQKTEKELNSTQDELKNKNDQLQKTEEELNSTQDELKNKNDQLQKTEKELNSTQDELKNKNDQLQKTEKELNSTQDELKNKNDQLQKTEEELNSTQDELKNKNDQLQKTEEELNSTQDELKNKNDQLQKTEKELNSTQDELKNKNDQLQKTEKELNSTQDELKTKNDQLISLTLAAKEQTVISVTKVIDFTNQYRKYLASGNLNFAVAVYGDAEIKDIFRLSKSNAVKQMTDEEIYREGFPCGNGRYIPKCFKCDGTDDCGNWSDERNCSTAVFPLGARVARGPGWKWGNQDGDPPGVGTVTEEVPDTFGDWLKVKWDSGYLGEYHIGAANMDLRAAAGYFCGPN